MECCKACISEHVCKYNDGVNEWCKGKCPHFKHYIYYLETPFGEMRYLTLEENEKKMDMYRMMSTPVEDDVFFIDEDSNKILKERENNG